MNIIKRPLFWILFFVVTTLVLGIIASQYTEPREIKLTHEQSNAIGEKIWLNEGAGRRENLIVWNEGEDFPSLGIGHFIWYPAGIEQQFQETFPGFLRHLSAKQGLAEWLRNIEHAPWRTREEFIAARQSEFMLRLQQLLQNTISEQTEYIVFRLETALPEVLKEIKNPFAKMKVRENFYHVSMQENGVYALIDYVNFKGEGTSDKERYNKQGWGLAQVLEQMNGSSNNIMQEFVDSADFVLTRRVANAPRDESQWLPGWRKRLQTYLKPTGKAEH